MLPGRVTESWKCFPGSKSLGLPVYRDNLILLAKVLGFDGRLRELFQRLKVNRVLFKKAPQTREAELFDSILELGGSTWHTSVSILVSGRPSLPQFEIQATSLDEAMEIADKFGTTANIYDYRPSLPMENDTPIRSSTQPEPNAS